MSWLIISILLGFFGLLDTFDSSVFFGVVTSLQLSLNGPFLLLNPKRDDVVLAFY
jgi:hypothetical protein